MEKGIEKRLVCLTILILLLVPSACIRNGQADPLTKEERAWLSEHDGKIRLAHDPDARPVDFLDGNGNFSGLAADYIRLIEDRLNFKFQILKINTWNQVVEKARAREVDVLCTFTKNREREQWMLFTEPYLTIKTVILTRNDFKGSLSLDRMNGMTVTFTKGWVIDDYLRENYGYLNMMPAVDDDTAMNHLLTKKAEAWITALTVAAIKIEDQRVTNIRVAGETDLSFKLSIASRKDWPVLNRILIKGLAMITEAERSAIFNKWIHVRQQTVFENRTFRILAMLVLGASVLAAALIFLWNSALKKKVAEKTAALEKERSLFKRIVDELPIMITRYDPDANMMFLNREFERVVGWTTEAVQTIDLMETVYPDPEYRRQAMEYMQKASAEWKEFRVRSKTGHIVESEWSNIRLEDGTQVGIGIDIGLRKKAEADLRKSRLIMESISDAVITTDTNGVITFWNAGAEKIYGYKSREALNQSIGILYRDEDLPVLEGLITDLMNGKELSNVEVTCIHKQGHAVDILLSLMAIRDENDDITELVGFTKDISRLKAYEKAVTVEKENAERYLNLAHVIFVALNRDGEVTLINKKGCEVLGYESREILGRNWFDHFIPEWQRKELIPVSRQLLNGEIEAAEYYENPILTKTGEERLVAWHNTILKDADGRITGHLSSGEDITRKRQLEIQLQQAQKMESIGNLAGGIAHDFNNILFPIVGMAELLLEDFPKGSLEHENVREIFIAGRRGSDLVKQILAFSRQSDHTLTPTRLQQVLTDVVKLCRATIPTDIDIRHDIQKDCGLVMADPTQMHQVAMNLMTNAYHAIGDTGGDIYLALEKTELPAIGAHKPDLKPGRYARITVRDTGKGIHPEIIDKIFEPYFTTKEKGKGTGLGLAVVHGIIKEHGGDISVSSEPGRGTVFFVDLPLMETAAPDESKAAVQLLPTGHERILLVDDEEPIARLEKKILERLGYRVTMFCSSIDALEAFQSDPHGFDLVISDMAMPGMTGDRLAVHLLSLRQDIPIIICTGFSEKLNQAKAKAMGIKAFLMKPVVKSDIATVVREALDKAGG